VACATSSRIDELAGKTAFSFCSDGDYHAAADGSVNTTPRKSAVCDRCDTRVASMPLAGKCRATRI